MTDDEARAECALLVARMRPDLVRLRVDEYIRGGLPAASLRDGGRSAERPEPSLDSVDASQLAILANYHRHLGCYVALARVEAWRSALMELRKAYALETGIIPEQHLSTEQLTELHQRARRLATLDHSTRAVECINCGRRIEYTPNDRPKTGRCGACYEYRRTHDFTDRPPELWERDIA